MKKFTRIFFAVAALFAFACTTDTTEDLGVQLGSGAGQTTLTLSLEESRTQLGTAVAGLYPVTWSEDDAISVNGVTSSKIEISENKSVATFTFNEVLAYPYTIAYPAAAEGKVLFADQQTHTEGTFAEGAAAMYGYKTAEGGLALNHLTGVLKIGVTGDKTLSFAQISNVDRAPIAGEFELDFATGEVTPTTASKELISYSFGEGLALGSSAQYIHATVPAGEYDELYVTLYDTEGGVMYATVKADDEKPLTAGKVREFSNTIAYAPNASVFVIKDKASLKEFAAQAATLKKDALVVADIDMTGEAWTPIDNYGKTLIGNGYAIKGLTAPLFGNAYGSIKGLHLRDVNIEETQNSAVGALARQLSGAGIDAIGEYTSPVVEHCSVSGKVVLNNQTAFVDTALNDFGECVAAGLVGRAYGACFYDCVNYATVEVKQCFPAGHTTALHPGVGGIVGYLNHTTHTVDGTSTKVTSHLNNLVNYGDIIFTDRSYTGETNVKTYAPLKPKVGGVVGYANRDNMPCEMHYITNHGDITISGIFGIDVFVSGTFGHIGTSNGSHIYNHGKITVEDLLARYIYIGGGVGYSANTTKLDNVHNYGEVYVAETATSGSIVCGGMQAYQPSSAVAADAGHSIISNSSNSAPVTVLCQGFAPELHDGTTLQYRVGGLAGWNQQYVQNCNNLEGGVVTCTGNLHNIDTSNYSICVGGLVAYKTVNAIDDSYNDADVICNINMTTSDTADLTAVRLNIGGISGYTNLPCRYVTNNGDVTWSGSVAGQLRIGGVFGQGNSVSTALPLYDNCVNNGAVTVADNSSIGHQFMIGGVAAMIDKNANCTNNGTVTIGKNVSFGGEKTYIAGALAYTDGDTDLATNNGPLVLEEGLVPATTITHIYIGGTMGHDYTKNVTNLENTAKGTITIKKSNLTSTVMVGGCVGCVPADNTKKTKLNYLIENFTNRAAITYKAYTTANKAIYVGGAVGYCYEGDDYHAPDTNNMYNYGPIRVEGDNLYDVKIGGVSSYFGGPTVNAINYEGGTITFDGTTRRHVHIGGAVEAVKDASTDLVNYGDITVDGKIGHTLYVGGCICRNNNYTRTRNSNHGDITVNAEIATNNFVGGFVYDSGAKLRYVDCHNTGNFTLGEKAVVNTQTRWGGFVGKLETTTAGVYNIFDGCSNSGDIIIKGNASKTAYAALGGIYGAASGTTAIIILNGFTNSGDIIFEGSQNGAFVADTDRGARNYLDMGGLFGTVDKSITFSNADYPTWTGNIVNTGTIKHTGTAANAVRIGGFAGSLLSIATPTVTDGKIINLGNLVCTGTFGSETAQYNGIGGIVGYTDSIIENAESYCSINAPKVAAGMITGSSRSATVIAKSCKVGGAFIENVIGEDADGNSTTIETEMKLDATNWMDYIYGTIPTWEEGTDYDGCSFLTVKPTI